MNKLAALIVGMMMAGCAASTKNVGTLVLPTSNKSIDVVQHRTDSHECAVGGVIQTFDATGILIDSQRFENNAFHCQMLNAGIQAGGMVGAASVLRPSITRNHNENEQQQAQGQNANAQATSNASAVVHKPAPVVAQPPAAKPAVPKPPVAKPTTPKPPVVKPKPTPKPVAKPVQINKGTVIINQEQ
jgi:hypothetical protein